MERFMFYVRLVPFLAMASWFYLVVPGVGPKFSALALTAVKTALAYL